MTAGAAAVALLAMLNLAVAHAAPAAPPRWWNDDWPYRVRIECDPEEGDVAFVRVVLAGRTTKDGRDLRLVDPDGQHRNFEIIHHDPQLSTLIQFRVPPDEQLDTWLYYGNTAAPPLDTLNPQFDTWQETWDAWKQEQSDRPKLVQKRQMLKDELIRLRRRRDRAEDRSADLAQLEERIAEAEKELEALAVPEARPAPNRPPAWYPRRGVLLRVYRKARAGHPDTLAELRSLIRRSTLEVAGFGSNVSDGFNRFGPSEDYISVYEGYLRVDAPGDYEFCTVSDDGSWLRINDRTVVEWPGRHTWEGAQHGEKNGRIRLKEGVARVQYYQEEGSGQQMAFLGWRPPGQEQFSGIPPEQWLGVRTARAAAHQARRQPVIAVPAVHVLNTYWVRDSDDRQATLVEFRDNSRSRAGQIVATRWSFGDGLEGTGPHVRHVYFHTGRPEVKLTVVDEVGNTDSVTCRPDIFYVDVRTRYFRFGNAEQYAEAAAGYDVDKMAREDLQYYAEFWGCLEKWREHVRAVDALIRRFPDLPELPQLAASAAHGAGQPEAYDPQHADELYQLALQGTADPTLRATLTLEHAALLAWGHEDYERARALLNTLLDEARTRSGKPARELRRKATILLGDVALLSGEYGEAERLYRAAQEMNPRKIEQAELLAKTGGYGYTVEDLLARGEFTRALEALDRWEDEFPLQKLEGYTFFLRGKVLYVQQPGQVALRYLELAERVSPRAVHVPEAVWLRANCLLTMKRYADALAQFERVQRNFTESEFFERAAERIDACRSALGTPEATGAGG